MEATEVKIEPAGVNENNSRREAKDKKHQLWCVTRWVCVSYGAVIDTIHSYLLSLRIAPPSSIHQADRFMQNNRHVLIDK